MTDTPRVVKMPGALACRGGGREGPLVGDVRTYASTIRRRMRGIAVTVRNRGVSATIRRGVSLVLSMGSRRRAARLDRVYDTQHGVETAGIIRLQELNISHPNRDAGVRYQPSDPGVVRRLLAGLEIDHEEFVFVDYGSGKGRVLLIASELPFKRIIGIEFSQELNDQARRNIANFRSETQRCRNIELYCIDATEYVPPPEPAVLYFYNPFNEHIMRRVLVRVRDSLDQHPRRLFFVVVGSSLLPVVEQAGFVRLPSASTDEGDDSAAATFISSEHGG
jgi:hypothetical protein